MAPFAAFAAVNFPIVEMCELPTKGGSNRLRVGIRQNFTPDFFRMNLIRYSKYLAVDVITDLVFLALYLVRIFCVSIVLFHSSLRVIAFMRLPRCGLKFSYLAPKIARCFL